MSGIPKNVQRGVELLDREFPDWRARIDANKLDQSSCFKCILGQLYGVPHTRAYSKSGYYVGLRELGIDKPGRYGFNTFGRQRWYNLNYAWHKVLGR